MYHNIYSGPIALPIKKLLLSITGVFFITVQIVIYYLPLAILTYVLFFLAEGASDVAVESMS